MDEMFYKKLKEKIEPFFQEKSGHDIDHTLRVYNNAITISEDENVDLDIVKTASLLHDIARHKENIGEVKCHAEEGAKMAIEILRSIKFPSEKIPPIAYAIRVHRYSKGIIPETKEAAILQDADRLDSLGSISIARVFSYGAKHGRPMHDPNLPFEDEGDYGKIESRTSINHFYKKILNIKPETFKTKKAREIAKKKYQIVLDFIENFQKEWNGEI